MKKKINKKESAFVKSRLGYTTRLRYVVSRRRRRIFIAGVYSLYFRTASSLLCLFFFFPLFSGRMSFAILIKQQRLELGSFFFFFFLLLLVSSTFFSSSSSFSFFSLIFLSLFWEGRSHFLPFLWSSSSSAFAPSFSCFENLIYIHLYIYLNCFISLPLLDWHCLQTWMIKPFLKGTWEREREKTFSFVAPGQWWSDPWQIFVEKYRLVVN